MTIHNALHLSDYVDGQYVVRKKNEVVLPVFEIEATH